MPSGSGLAVGVMHTVSMATLSIGLLTARRMHALTLPGVLGALSLSVVFHGLYNLLVSEAGAASYIGYALPLVSAVPPIPLAWMSMVVVALLWSIEISPSALSPLPPSAVLVMLIC